MIHALANGDITKYEDVNKLKKSQAEIIMVIKEKADYIQWTQEQQLKEKA